MKKIFGTSLVCFVLATLLVASALPTMAGRLKSYDGKTGIMILELEDKSVKKFRLTDKTKCEWMGRNTSPGAIRKGSKVSIQIAGALNASPLKAAKIVDWSNSDKIVAKGAVAPYHTKVSQYASTAGGGGTPDGAPKMNSHAHQDMAAIGHGGSQNQIQGPNGHSQPNSNPTHSSSMQSPSNVGPQHYSNQGASMTAPLEMMNIDPYSSSHPQMGANDPYSTGMATDPGTLMGVDSSGSGGMYGMESAYGGAGEKLTGRILDSSIERGFITLQPFENPSPVVVLLQQAADAPIQMLIPGQMIEVVGTRTPQGFRATEIRAAQGGF